MQNSIKGEYLFMSFQKARVYGTAGVDVHETYFWKLNLHYINKSDTPYPFSNMQWKRQSITDHKSYETKGCMTLRHLNKIIRSQQNLFLKNK